MHVTVSPSWARDHNLKLASYTMKLALVDTLRKKAFVINGNDPVLLEIPFNACYEETLLLKIH